MAAETTEPTTTEQEPTEQATEPVEATTEPEQQTEDTTTEATEDEGKTFDLAYVKKLRDESAKYRQRAAKTDELGKRLHTALVSATGRLQDATDLPYDESYLESPEALSAAIDALLSSKPHLASRKPSGVIPQGATATPSGASLSGLLRRNAGV